MKSFVLLKLESPFVITLDLLFRQDNSVQEIDVAYELDYTSEV